MRLTLIACLAATVLGAAPAIAQPGDALDVTVTGLHSAKGKLVACLWSDKQGFPSCEKSSSARKVIVPVNATTMHLAFPNIAAGTYAITIHHDEDGNGRMKHNFIGMPAEGVGVSNNPGGMPGFGKSLVKVAAGSEIAIRMRYLFD